MAAPRSRSPSPPRAAGTCLALVLYVPPGSAHVESDYPRSITPYDDRSPRSVSPRRSPSYSDRDSRDRLNGARGRSYSRDYSEDRGRAHSRSLSRDRRHSDDYGPAPRSSKVDNDSPPYSASSEDADDEAESSDEAEFSDDYMSYASEPLANGYQIVVEKLTKNITEAHLQSLFSRYGTILDIDMPVNRAFGTNRGTAYIVFETGAAAELAFARMHEGWVDGAQISVSLVVARARMSSRSPPPPLPESPDDAPASPGPRRYARDRDRDADRDRDPDRRYRDRSPLRGPPPPRRPADTYYGAGVRGARAFDPERDRDADPPGQPLRRGSRSRSRSPYGSRSPEYGRYGRRYSRRSGSADSYERERRR